MYNRLFILIAISCAIFFVIRKDKETFALKSLIFLFVFITLLHIQFAKIGSLLRYEMYLVTIGIFINSIIVIKYLNGKSPNLKIPIIIFLYLLIIPFSISTYKAMKNVPTASVNIYQMQFKMSEFINKYYEKNTIALNDIGAVNYYCDIHCIDLWGLANRDIMDYRRKLTYSPEKIFEISKKNNTAIAIVFESWFQTYGGIPPRWICAGKWTIPNNITCGADSVTFYVTDSINYVKLTNSLKMFSKELPLQVKQKGY
ncbi:MAG: hypothetical protein NTU73_00690 [Ignavibacteriae bacterium]|nr:hypothetical protein [Ignavibacteriota bacterium]